MIKKIIDSGEIKQVYCLAISVVIVIAFPNLNYDMIKENILSIMGIILAIYMSIVIDTLFKIRELLKEAKSTKFFRGTRKGIKENTIWMIATYSIVLLFILFENQISCIDENSVNIIILYGFFSYLVFLYRTFVMVERFVDMI